MDECNWIDRKFVSCEDFDWHIIEYNLTSGGKAKKCYHCKADIRKPEQKPLIVKSGETWVANWKGVDYLWTGKTYDFCELYALESEDVLFFLDGYGIKRKGWKPFSEIELTDEIAKLRPVVIHRINPFQLDVLYGVHNKLVIIYYENPYGTVDSDYSIDGFHLATPHELQEIE